MPSVYHCHGSQADTTHDSRIEGLSKGILRKFRKVDPETWKTSDLQKVLSGDMGIRERPDQKVNVQVTIRVKGTIVVHRQYDDSDSQDGGKLKTFFSEFQDLGDQYSVNYARAINLASALYEQPSNLGIPMAFMASMTAVGNIHAKIKRGSSRGLLYRDIEYDIMGFAQANRIAAIPMKVPMSILYIQGDLDLGFSPCCHANSAQAE